MEQHLEGQHAVAGVEEQAGEHLVRLVAQARLEVVAHRLRAFQRGVLAQLLGQVAPGHFQHRLQLGELGGAEAEMATEGGKIGLQQRTKTTELLQKPPRQLHSAATGHPGAQEYRQQFGIAQTRCSTFEQLLPRALRRRPITNAHKTSQSSRPAVPVRAL
ncbi:hypothetical protein D3C81_1138600 [compost metagenome]